MIVGTGRPRHRSTTVEQSASVCSIVCGKFAKVVATDKIVGMEHLVLQVSTISINLNLGKIAESSLAHNGIGKLVDARRRYTNLSPLATAQYALLGVSIGWSNIFGQLRRLHRRVDPSKARRNRSSLGLGYTAKHKTCEHLIFAITHNDRAELGMEHRQLAVERHVAAYLWQCRRQSCSETAIGYNIGRGHIYKLGIYYLERVCGVAIGSRQALGMGKERQNRVDLHFLRSKVVELLRHSRHGCHAQTHYYIYGSQVYFHN